MQIHYFKRYTSNVRKTASIKVDRCKILLFLVPLLSSDFFRVFKIKKNPNRSSCVILSPSSSDSRGRCVREKNRLLVRVSPPPPRLFTSEWSRLILLRNIFCATTLCCSEPPPHPFPPFVYFVSTLFWDSRPRLCCQG
ncbi:hypothetical protein CDAR_397081 [Caerostris darwini]|uniref:Uncharacterized protein n=1 Tax=Caerostris darwini TaxID=1538125 RepID=A0AAV4MNT1_9ARAC|nr:hypothetical protein CDAR_397081 [Caerostris darwini]